MKAAILTIGDELLSGKTINTNASWISHHVKMFGCEIVRQVTAPDKEKEIIDCISILFTLPIDLVLCTGGLGPTHDDITRNSIFQFFNSKGLFDDEYWKDLKSRFSSIGYSIPDSNKSQAIVPDNGETFSNPIGSARGLLFNRNKITFMAMPGVPSEMEAMIKKTVIPWIKKNSKQEIFSINVRTTGLPESVLYEKIKVEDSYLEFLDLGYYPSLYGVDIRITGKNITLLEELKEKIVNIAGKYIYNIGEESLEDIVVNKLLENNLCIATAESCTGGLIGHRITQVPGSSSVYKGGIVAYSNEAKLSQLNIKRETLDKYGAVSKETASEMAFQVKTIFDSDIGISVTGIAGPDGGTKDKPVGLVFAGFCNRDGVKTKQFNFYSIRESNKVRTSQGVLNLIMKNISDNG